MTKSTKWPVRPAKTQIRLLGFRSMCSSMCSWGSKLSSCGQWRHWLDWVDAQADLSLRWAHKSFCSFCRAAAQIWFMDWLLCFGVSFVLITSLGEEGAGGCASPLILSPCFTSVHQGNISVQFWPQQTCTYIVKSRFAGVYSKEHFYA